MTIRADVPIDAKVIEQDVLARERTMIGRNSPLMANNAVQRPVSSGRPTTLAEPPIPQSNG